MMADNWTVGGCFSARIDGSDYSRSFVSVEDPSLDAGGGVALVVEKGENAETMRRANMIAAAPDLLAACEAFIELFRDSDMRPEDECHELFGKCYEAIAKAKGGAA